MIFVVWWINSLIFPHQQEGEFFELADWLRFFECIARSEGATFLCRGMMSPHTWCSCLCVRSGGDFLINILINQSKTALSSRNDRSRQSHSDAAQRSSWTTYSFHSFKEKHLGIFERIVWTGEKRHTILPDWHSINLHLLVGILMVWLRLFCSWIDGWLVHCNNLQRESRRVFCGCHGRPSGFHLEGPPTVIVNYVIYRLWTTEWPHIPLLLPFLRFICEYGAQYQLMEDMYCDDECTEEVFIRVRVRDMVLCRVAWRPPKTIILVSKRLHRMPHYQKFDQNVLDPARSVMTLG